MKLRPSCLTKWRSWVKLDDEAGAAGLVFCSDGGDKHYGFYPSDGKLRLTRFDGPDVFSWNVLGEVASEHYRPGEWNHLKVRVEKDQLKCFVNDQQVFESKDRTASPPARWGWRSSATPRPSIRRFEVAAEIKPINLSDDALAQGSRGDREVAAAGRAQE